MLPRAIQYQTVSAYSFYSSGVDECFSIAVLSTAMEKIITLCALCASSEAGGRYKLTCLHSLGLQLGKGLRYEIK